MAESTLAIERFELRARLGAWAGFGRGNEGSYTEAAWTTVQQNAIDESVKSGLTRVYTCGHDWSFLHPYATLTLASGAQTIDMPDDFMGLDDGFVVTAPQNARSWPVEITNEAMVQWKHAASPDTTGRPLFACCEAIKGTTADEGQRFRVRVWPVADQAYTVKIPYYVIPDNLTVALPFPYGGAEHAELYFAACKAAFERDWDDRGGARDGPGPQEVNFQQALAQAIKNDSRKKAQFHGYNGDRSNVPGLRRVDFHTQSRIRFNGVVP